MGVQPHHGQCQLWGITYYAAAGASGTQNLAIMQSQTPTFPMNCAVLATAFLSVSAIDEMGT